MNIWASLTNGARGSFLYPDLLSLALWQFLAFLLLKEFLACLSVFPLFSKDFRASEEKKILAFFQGRKNNTNINFSVPISRGHS